MTEEKRCFRCGILESQSNLFDAIYENEIAMVCENCARLEDIPVLKKPSSSQIEEAKRPYTVYERLARAAGMKDKAELAKQHLQKKDIPQLRKPIDFLSGKEKPELKQKLDLKDNFHWEIFRARRKERISQQDLAEKLGVTEKAIKALEYGQLTDGSEELIGRIEDLLDINLRRGEKRIKEENRENEAARDIETDEIELLRETKELERVEKEGKELLEEAEKAKSEISFDIESSKNMTLGDLQKRSGKVPQLKIAEKDIGKITLADLQEINLKKKREAREEQEWMGKTKEEREKTQKLEKEEKKQADELIGEFGDLEEV